MQKQNKPVIQKFKKWKKVGMEKKWTNKMGCLCNSDSLLIIL